MRTILLTTLFLISITSNAQETMNKTSTYEAIPDAPENFTPGAVVSRVIDGLGFRYYWASEGLTDEDLKYAPGNKGRSIEETIDHIYGLSKTILNTAKNLPNIRSVASEKMTARQQRVKTLENLKEASEIMLASNDLNKHNIIYRTKNGDSTYPLWYILNGQIEDAVWHAGQLVVMRRSAGNPINSKVNVFQGRLNK